MTLLFLIVIGMAVAAIGGVLIGLFLAEVIDRTRAPEDELARRDRRREVRTWM